MEIVDSDRPPTRRRVNIWWMALTIASTATTAYLMSIFGFIPVNPVYAVTIGSIFGFLFVLYQIFYIREMRKRIDPEVPKTEGELL